MIGKLARPQTEGWFAFLGLLALVLATYAPALRNGFVFDDHWLVERNPVVRTLDPATHLTSPFWSRWERLDQYYRPLVTWSVAVDRAIYGTRPWGYHLTNLLLHAANAFLVWLLTRQLAGPVVASIAAACFAVHPVQTEAVVWVMGRTDALAATFMLVAVWLHGRGLARPERRLLAAALVGLAFCAALLCKESAVTLPAWIVGFNFARARREGMDWRSALRATSRRLVPLFPLAALLGGYLLLRHAVLGQVVGGGPDEEAFWNNPIRGEPLGVRWMTGVHVAGRYLLLLVWPSALSADYRPNVVEVVRSAGSPEFLVPLAALTAAAVTLVVLSRRVPVCLFGSVGACGSYLLVSHFLFAAPIIMAERFLYIPMVGLSAIFAGAVVHLAARPIPLRLRQPAGALLVLLLAALACRSFVRTLDWRDDLTLFEATVRAAPESAMAWNNLGVEQMTRGKLDAALLSFERAIEIRDDNHSARLNHATALHRAGELERAEEELRRAAADFPASGKVLLEWMQVQGERADRLAAEGREEEARSLREGIVERTGRAAGEAFEKAGSGVKAVFLLIVAQNLARLNRTPEAETVFQQAIDDVEREVRAGGAVPEAAHGVRSAVLGAAAAFERDRGRPAAAAARFRQAAAAADDADQREVAAELWLQAAKAFQGAGQLDEALQAARHSERRAEGKTRLVEEAHMTAAGLLARQGDLAAALELAASSARVLLAAAEGALESGRPAQALPVYDRVLALEPATPRALNGRARTRLALGDLDGAERDLEQLLEVRPAGKAAAAAWTDLSRIELLRGDRGAALGRLERAVAADARYSEARYRRATILLENGRAGEAEQELQRALDDGLPPSAAADAWFQLAKLSVLRGDSSTARERLARCVALQPAHQGAADLLRRVAS